MGSAGRGGRGSRRDIGKQAAAGDDRGCGLCWRSRGGWVDRRRRVQDRSGTRDHGRDGAGSIAVGAPSTTMTVTASGIPRSRDTDDAGRVVTTIAALVAALVAALAAACLGAAAVVNVEGERVLEERLVVLRSDLEAVGRGGTQGAVNVPAELVRCDRNVGLYPC